MATDSACSLSLGLCSDGLHLAFLVALAVSAGAALRNLFAGVAELGPAAPKEATEPICDGGPSVRHSMVELASTAPTGAYPCL